MGFRFVPSRLAKRFPTDRFTVFARSTLLYSGALGRTHAQLLQSCALQRKFAEILVERTTSVARVCCARSVRSPKQKARLLLLKCEKPFVLIKPSYRTSLISYNMTTRCKAPTQG